MGILDDILDHSKVEAGQLRIDPQALVIDDRIRENMRREMLREAEHARIVVVGTRGLGGFAGLRMGSVSLQVVEHAACDVLVVRTGTDTPTPDRRGLLDRFFDR